MDNNTIYTKLTNILPNKYIVKEAMGYTCTTFKVGGPIGFLILPENIEQILNSIATLKELEVPYFIMGNGSNIVFSDKGYDGVVIKISNNFSDISVDNNVISAQSGISLAKLSNFAMNNSLTGLEFAGGIPGTLGGAVYMNAGAYDGEMKNVIISTEYVDSEGNISILNEEEHKFDYRESIFQSNNGIILSSKMKLSQGNKEKIKEKSNDFNNKRKDKQPLNMPSAGSAFKRPKDNFAAALIDECGLKGVSVGGAQVSTKHSGFIVNTGNATANDIKELIKKVQEIVYSKTNILLEPEIRFID